jgi:hypothetical protein
MQAVHDPCYRAAMPYRSYEQQQREQRAATERAIAEYVALRPGDPDDVTSVHDLVGDYNKWVIDVQHHQYGDWDVRTLDAVNFGRFMTGHRVRRRIKVDGKQVMHYVGIRLP